MGDFSNADFGGQIPDVINNEVFELVQVCSKDNSRDNCAKLERALTESMGCHVDVLDTPDPACENHFFVFVINDSENRYLIDPLTQKRLSKSYRNFSKASWNGFIYVGDKESGFGYIDYFGNEIFPPRKGNKLEKFYNGANIVCDEIAITNIKTQKTLFDRERGDVGKLEIWGNVYRVITEKKRKGTHVEYEEHIYNENGEELDTGVVLNSGPLTREVTPIPYNIDIGVVNAASVYTVAAFQGENGLYGLIDCMKGKVLYRPQFTEVGKIPLKAKDLKHPPIRLVEGSTRKLIAGARSTKTAFEINLQKTDVEFPYTYKADGGYALYGPNLDVVAKIRTNDQAEFGSLATRLLLKSDEEK